MPTSHVARPRQKKFWVGRLVCVLVYTSPYPGRNTWSLIVISMWINVFIPRNRFNYWLAHSGLGCCSVCLTRSNFWFCELSFGTSAPVRELQCFTMHFNVYFTLPQAHYIVSHSNVYVHQCFYSRNRFSYLLAHFRPWLLLWKFAHSQFWVVTEGVAVYFRNSQNLTECDCP